jgi:hypothetical protein
VVALELDRGQVFYTMIASALLGVVIGIALGVAKHDVAVGLAVGAAVFGLIAPVQAAVVWRYK